MSIAITQGVTRKPAASKNLVNIFSTESELCGKLFIGFPFVRSSEGAQPLDAILITRETGIIVFDLIEGPDEADYVGRQDDFYNGLAARLGTHRELMEHRALRIPIHTISFGPGLSNSNRPPNSLQEEYPLVSTSESLKSVVKRFTWRAREESVYEKALSAIEAVSTIRHRRTKRVITREDSRGGRLKQLENAIATMDKFQTQAAFATCEGVQRIRGLAGSGKTIVLARKAAYLHAHHPEWNIGITFNTRSLKEHFRLLITRFMFEEISEEPDWDKLHIVNAWGAPGDESRDGIYHQFCRTHDLEYFNYGTAVGAFGTENTFARVCDRALEQVHESRAFYDAILVDEAQDLSPAFLRLCYAFLNDFKRLVYAYDELQTLTGQSLPSPEEIFGENDEGLPVVQFGESAPGGPTQDIILPVCYRNSRPLLTTAHALGFGIYRKEEPSIGTGLVQMFDHPQLWEEVGYQSLPRTLEEGSLVVLTRTEETSPAFLENHSNIDDLIKFSAFDNQRDHDNWITNEIKKDLDEGELRHSDIMVINLNPKTTRRNVGPIRARLLESGVNSHLAGVTTKADTFFRRDGSSVTFTGVHRAKGNEAGMVYVINAHEGHSESANVASIRNRLFTAITRSTAWVRILGIGVYMEVVKEEYNKLRAHKFKLEFVYPTSQQRQHLRIIRRDMSDEDRSRISRRKQSVQELVRDLEAGDLYIEDLPEGDVEKLRNLLVQPGSGPCQALG